MYIYIYKTVGVCQREKSQYIRLILILTLNGNASILACMSINLLNYYLTQNYQFIVIPEFSFTFRHSKCLLYKENSIMILINVISVFPIFILVKLSDFSIILTIQNSLGSIRRMA